MAKAALRRAQAADLLFVPSTPEVRTDMFPQFTLVLLLALTGLAGQAIPDQASASSSGSSTIRAGNSAETAAPRSSVDLKEIAIAVAPAATAKLTDSDPAPQADQDEVVADQLVAPGRIESEVVEATDFQTIGVTWPAEADVDGLGGQVRTRTDGEWSAWIDLAPGDDAPDAGTADSEHAARGGTDPVSIGDSDAVQLAFKATAAGSPAGLNLTLIGSELEAAPDAVVGAAAPAATSGDGQAVVRAASLPISLASATPAPRVISRSEWGAPAQVCAPDVAATLVGAVVHHTAGSNSYSTVAQAMQQIRNDAAYHISGRGWCDLGYNFVVDKWGNVYEGRADSLTKPVIGVHAGGFNTGTVGVSMLGTYGEAPSAATQKAVGEIIGWRLGMYGVSPQSSMTYSTGAGENSRFVNQTVTLPRVFGHRQVSYTACPGDGGYAALPSIRATAAIVASGVQRNVDPFGQLDSLTATTGSVTASGWARDPDTTSPIDVHVYVDAGGRAGTANLDRPDLAALFSTTRHGYSITVPASPGSHRVCVYAINAPAGDNPTLGCRTITVPGTAVAPVEPPAAVHDLPVGQVESVTTGVASIVATGWALDPDTADPIDVHVYVDTGAKAASANLTRPDLGQYFASTAHGYSVTVPASPGAHRVCVYAINTPAGNNPRLGCRTVTVSNTAPSGQLESVTAGVAGIVATGWARDPDSAAPIEVHVYVGSGGKATVAKLNRPDLSRYFPSTAHGYSVTVPAPPGRHTVCAYAINAPAGNNPSLGCRVITVANSAPTGQVDTVVTGARSVTVTGWARDPDSNAPIQVHVYVDGGAKATVANLNRPDLARFFPSTAHGYSVTVSATPGIHTVCAYAINTPAGNNPSLGCRRVTV